MSVSSSDIIVLGSANMPENDSSTSGGAIDTATKIIFTDISATDEVEIVSDSGSDTSQTVTIYGRDSGGNIVSEAETLNGTTVVTTAQTFERILKITLNTAAAGTVTVRKESDNVTIATMAAGITTVRRPFTMQQQKLPVGLLKYFLKKYLLKIPMEARTYFPQRYKVLLTLLENLPLI